MSAVALLPVLAIGFGVGILLVAGCVGAARSLELGRSAPRGVPATDVARMGWHFLYWPGIVGLGTLVIAWEVFGGAASFPWATALGRGTTGASMATGAATAAAVFIVRRGSAARPGSFTKGGA